VSRKSFANDQAVTTGEPAKGTSVLPPFFRQRFISNAKWVFALMFIINTLNYLDRLIVAAVGPVLKDEFHIHDDQIGMLSSAFIIIYTLATLPGGLLGDRFSRARVIAAGVAIWSALSAATAFVTGFFGLFVTRALVGVGEATYAPAGAALLGAYFPVRIRARVMGFWQSAQILGTVLAFGLSAFFLAHFTHNIAWRIAFFVAGVPGILIAVLMWFVADSPKREAHAESEAEAQEEGIIGEHGHLSFEGGWRGVFDDIRAAARIRTVWIVAVLEAFVFILVTPAVTFLSIYLQSPAGPFHLQSTETAFITATLIILGGGGGILVGGYLADRLSQRYRGGRLIAASIGFGLGVPFFTLALLTHSLPLFIILGIVAVLAINIPIGPLVAVVQDAAPVALRATAFSLALLIGHALGDFWAPTAVGALSTALHEQTGLALVIIGTPTLIVGSIVAAIGVRIYAADLAARERAIEAHGLDVNTAL
jgi:MFS family permease